MIALTGRNGRRVPRHEERGAQRPQDTTLHITEIRTQETPGGPEDKDTRDTGNRSGPQGRKDPTCPYDASCL